MLREYVVKIMLILVLVAENSSIVEAATPIKKLLIEPSTSDVYTGQGKLYRITFKSIELEKLVNSFPEPPMVITNLKNGRKCNCDGGIWERDKVYLTQNERLLIVGSYSGSSSYFEFYDTTSCKKIKEVNASNIDIIHSVNFKSAVPIELIQYIGR